MTGTQRRCRWKDAGNYEEPGRCRWCGRRVPWPRRFCSDPHCKVEIRMRAEPRFARKMVGKRDRGICQLCGCDTLKLLRVMRAVERIVGYSLARSIWIDIGFHGTYRRCGDRWQMDHVVPVVEGGGKCGLENLRLVCSPCHKELTAALCQRLAYRRRAESLTAPTGQEH